MNIAAYQAGSALVPVLDSAVYPTVLDEQQFLKKTRQPFPLFAGRLGTLLHEAAHTYYLTHAICEEAGESLAHNLLFMRWDHASIAELKTSREPIIFGLAGKDACNYVKTESGAKVYESAQEIEALFYLTLARTCHFCEDQERLALAYFSMAVSALAMKEATQEQRAAFQVALDNVGDYKNQVIQLPGGKSIGTFNYGPTELTMRTFIYYNQLMLDFCLRDSSCDAEGERILRTRIRFAKALHDAVDSKNKYIICERGLPQYLFRGIGRFPRPFKEALAAADTPAWLAAASQAEPTDYNVPIAFAIPCSDVEGCEASLASAVPERGPGSLGIDLAERQGSHPSPRELCATLAAKPWDSENPIGVKPVFMAEIDIARAEPACRAAVAADRTDGQARHWLARVLNAAERYEEARRISELGRTDEIAFLTDSPEGISLLGGMTLRGEGEEKDLAVARQLFVEAADMGSTNAVASLGHIYANGQGVEQDLHTAAELFRSAGAKGNGDAVFLFGVLHVKGLVPDGTEAVGCGFVQLAEEYGHPDAASYYQEHCLDLPPIPWAPK
jgi:hypothetical protein